MKDRGMSKAIEPANEAAPIQLLDQLEEKAKVLLKRSDVSDSQLAEVNLQIDTAFSSFLNMNAATTP